MSMWRSGSLALALCAAGSLTAAGCADHGTYTVSWTFANTAGSPTGEDCGQHGVDSIHVTGASMEGDAEDIVTLCPPGVAGVGSFTHEVPVGTWTFTIHQVDVRGNPIVGNEWDDQGQLILDNGYPVAAPDPTVSGTVPKDRNVDLDQVPLAPRPLCNDGIDNDGDGRIDLDDPDCKGSSNTNTECPETGC